MQPGHSDQPQACGSLPSQLTLALSYVNERLHDLSEDDISHSIQLAQELLAKLTAEEHVREQNKYISIHLPRESEPGFRVEKDRLVAHMLFGRMMGSRILAFGYHPFHAIAIVSIYCAQMAIWLYSLFVPTPEYIVWSAVGMQCYLTFWIAAPIHVDLARAQALTFEIWYLMFAQFTLFVILIPISVEWDVRGIFSIAHGIGCIGAYMCDAMPPIASECIRLGWMAWVCVAVILSVGYEFDYFDVKHRFSMFDSEFNLGDLILSRCLVLGIFGFRYCYTYWHYPRDCMYFKVSLVRSDQNERFVILRELGLLPMKNHRPFHDTSGLSSEHFRELNQKSSTTQSKTLTRTRSLPEDRRQQWPQATANGGGEQGAQHGCVVASVAPMHFMTQSDVGGAPEPNLAVGSQNTLSHTRSQRRSMAGLGSAMPSVMFET